MVRVQVATRPIIYESFDQAWLHKTYGIGGCCRLPLSQSVVIASFVLGCIKPIRWFRWLLQGAIQTIIYDTFVCAWLHKTSGLDGCYRLPLKQSFMTPLFELGCIKPMV